MRKILSLEFVLIDYLNEVNFQLCFTYSFAEFSASLLI